MRTLLHISDLHFNRVDPAVTQAVLSEARSLAPDLIIVSGDLTQRARRPQFIGARHFLDALPAHWLSIPGNHDIPLFNLPRRLIAPFGHYRTYISRELEPTYVDNEMAVIGVNTTRRSRHSEGSLSGSQLKALKRRIASLPESLIKIVVTHHPIYSVLSSVPPEGIYRSGPSLFLSGHLHASRVTPSTRFCRPGYPASLVIESGTTTSTRLRGESNSFNRIRISEDRIGRRVSITSFVWNPASRKFFAADGWNYELREEGWINSSTTNNRSFALR